MSKKDQQGVNITSHNQSGGITAHTVHQYVNTKPQREFDADLSHECKAALEQNSGKFAKTHVAAWNADVETQQFAEQFCDGLKQLGYSCSTSYNQMIGGTIPEGIHLEFQEEVAIFNVYPQPS